LWGLEDCGKQHHLEHGSKSKSTTIATQVIKKKLQLKARITHWENTKELRLTGISLPFADACLLACEALASSSMTSKASAPPW
jgi:hypothetical protein